MFVSEEVAVPIPTSTAWHRMLVHLDVDGLQVNSSEAFDVSRTLFLRAGALGLSKTVEVQILSPYVAIDTMVIPVRWNVTGPSGHLFPQLDANLEIAPTVPGHSRLRIIGSYRPPLGALGTTLDQAVLHHVAEATLRRLLGTLRDALVAETPELAVPSLWQDAPPST
ncbi:MAG: hypothetical protein Q7V57_12445 [Actinomycetota bacterium]|nr:hypothetical protein [Actinomycetota bacterium]